MSRPEDDFTSTVDGAAGFEVVHGDSWWDDPPSLSDLVETPKSTGRENDAWAVAAREWGEKHRDHHR